MALLAIRLNGYETTTELGDDTGKIVAVIESRDITDLVFERLPDFAATSHLYYPGADAGRRPGNHASCLIRLGLYGACLAARRDEASLARILRVVEQIIEEGRRMAVEIYFLEVLGGGLNELGVRWSDIAALAGPKTRESVRSLRAMGFWEAIVLPRALSDLLR